MREATRGGFKSPQGTQGGGGVKKKVQKARGTGQKRKITILGSVPAKVGFELKFRKKLGQEKLADLKIVNNTVSVSRGTNRWYCMAYFSVKGGADSSGGAQCFALAGGQVDSELDGTTAVDGSAFSKKTSKGGRGKPEKPQGVHLYALLAS